MDNPFLSNLQTDPRICGQVSQLRASGQLGLMWQAVTAATASDNDARKALVLQHPDLAARVAKALGLSSPDRWNGRMPPATVPGKGDYMPNPSPLLARLREIVAEAEARQQQGWEAA